VPGDIVVADVDGVCVVPRNTSAAVVLAGADRVAGEETKRTRLKNGELSLDIYDWRKKLVESGVTWVDSHPANN
jgi:4-hydroxy-4-methyl-2-oxoglutarate aldolase